MQKWLDLGRKLLREVFQLGAEARLHALPGPHQLLAERGKRRALAALGFDQRYAKKVGPLLDQIPDVAIGEPCIGRGAGELSGLSDLVQDSEHHHDGLGSALLPETPDGFDLDVQHRAPYYEIAFIL